MTRQDFDDIEYVEKTDVPARQNRQVRSIWKKRFDEIPDGKSAMLRFNNRQRAHQVRGNVRDMAWYFKISVGTRVISATPEIHGCDGWLLYFWKNEEVNNGV